MVLTRVCGHLRPVLSSLRPRLAPLHTTAASMERKEHLDLTAGQFRDPGAVGAKVVAMSDLSPSVKSLTLRMDTHGTTFEAGQWLDFFIPGEEKVGGFSMYSAPSELQANNTLKLAIKASTWPPAHWVTTQCKTGDDVQIRVGGDFLYPSDGFSEPHSLLLVAGGVGINPLFSIWLHTKHLADMKSSGTPQAVSLLYSAKIAEELIFQQDLVQGQGEGWKMSPFLTREGAKQRLGKKDLAQELDGLQGRKVCFLCGPPEMTDQVAKWLEELGVAKDDVKYETWW